MSLRRRHFLAASSLAWLGRAAPARAQGVADRILILIELKGGNDGLNTVVPYADSTYYQLRNSVAIRADEVIRLDARTGLHPELKGLMPLWEKNELAIVQGVGYPEPNLSHFRSIEIWDTASKSQEYLPSGWVTRAMQAGLASRARFTAEGVFIGGNTLGPLAQSRAVALNNPVAFVSQMRAVSPATAAARANPALQHLLKVEADMQTAALGLRAEPFNFATVFPQGGFGNAVRACAQVVASQQSGRGGVPVIVLTMGSFDTHQNQLPQHANLLRQLAEGLAALKSALTELNAWDRSLVMTFSEFGRRARQNQSGGTDHGTAAPHFMAGGAVRGGLFGQAPDLQRLDAEQNLLHAVDFRQLYATVARRWWGVDAQAVVRGQFDEIGFLRG
jgi:uncharacterized protein (DUF1501 family)